MRTPHTVEETHKTRGPRRPTLLPREEERGNVNIEGALRKTVRGYKDKQVMLEKGSGFKF